jgi:RNA polymerase sigma-70 factor, ECF subfamily
MTKQDELQGTINGCRQGDRLSQRQLYRHFYRYGMNVCNRYARSEMEAEEMLNDAFLRIFTKIEMYNPELSFLGWIHTIFVRSSINYLRKYQNTPLTTELDNAPTQSVNETILARLSADEVLSLVRHLPPSYRAAFNLSVVEGYAHAEIAEMLGISEGTVKSNLMKARLKMQAMVTEMNSFHKKIGNE